MWCGADDVEGSWSGPVVHGVLLVLVCLFELCVGDGGAWPAVVVCDVIGVEDCVYAFPGP